MSKINKLEKKQISSLISLYNSGALDKVEKYVKNLIKKYSKELILHIILGAAYAGQGKLQKSINSYNNAIKIDPNYAETYNNLGNVLHEQGKFDEAIENYKKAIHIKIDYSEPYYNYAVLLTSRGKLDEAIIKYNKAIYYNKSYFKAYYNIGNINIIQKKLEEAKNNFKKAININPKHYESYNNLGNVLKEQKNFDEAIKSYSKSIKINPNYYEAENNLGSVYQEQRKFQKAIISYKKAISANPNYVESHNNLGTIFHELGKFNDAVLCYKKAIKINKNYYESYNNLGTLFHEIGKLDLAIEYFKKAYKLNNNLGDALINYWHLRQYCCDWKEQGLMFSQISSYIKNYNESGLNDPLKPFPLLSMFDDPAIHLKASEYYSKTKILHNKVFLKKNILSNNKKLKIAYLSDAFKDHPFSYLTAGMIECHSRKKFETYCLSTSAEDNSGIYKRIKKSCDFFIDVSKKTNYEIAKLIEEESINIIIDCNGYTKGSRLEIFSYIDNIPKVGFLGYPGTLGGNINQYMIADSTVIPKNKKNYYSEKIIFLPNSYYPTDRNIKVERKKISKASCLLPKNSFVFCCFNQSYKITPLIFNIWMQLLKKTNNSVLWLIATNKWAQKNLFKEARRQGIRSNRIIFAKKLPNEKHLARIKNADLFLDTIPYNAHTTACDALWAGVPVVTIKGESFAARVAASLLKAIELPELITSTTDEYTNKALELANSPIKLQNIKNKLNNNRFTTPLFNTKKYTKNLEVAYKKIWKDYKKLK